MDNVLLHFNELNSPYGSVVPITGSRAQLGDRIGDLYCFATNSFENDDNKNIVVKDQSGAIIYRGKVVIGPENELIKLQPDISIQQKEQFEEGGHFIVKSDVDEDEGLTDTEQDGGKRRKSRSKKSRKVRTGKSRRYRKNH